MYKSMFEYVSCKSLLFISGGYVSETKDIYCLSSYDNNRLSYRPSAWAVKQKTFNSYSFGNLDFEYNSLEVCASLFKKKRWERGNTAYAKQRQANSICSHYSPYILYDEESGACSCVKKDSTCKSIPFKPVSSRIFKVFDGNDKMIVKTYFS